MLWTRATALGLLGIGVVLTCDPAVRRRARALPLQREPALWAAGALVASALVSTLSSRTPAISWMGAYTSFAGLTAILAGVVLFLAARLVRDPLELFWRLCHAAAFATTGVVAYALVQIAGHDPLPWTWQPSLRGQVRPFSTLGHPNFLADTLVAMLPMVGALAMAAHREGRRLISWATGALAVASAFVVVASLSRAGFLALAGALLVLSVAGASARLGLWRPRTLLLGAAALLVAAALPLGPGGGGIGPRFAGLSGDGRLEIWRAAVRMFGEAPVLGVGVDGFAAAFPVARRAAYWDTDFGRKATRAHSLPLHLLATQGLLGVAAGLAAAAALGIAVRGAWRRARCPDEALAVACLTAATVAFGIRSVFSFTTAAPAGLLACQAGLLVALAGGRDDPAAPLPESPHPPWRGLRVVSLAVASAALAFALSMAVLRPFLADAAAAAGRQALQAGEPERAAAALDRATALAPGRDVYWGYRGEAAHRAAMAAPEAAREAALRQAAGLAAQAIHLAPHDAWHRARRALVYADLARIPGSGVGWPDVATLLDQAFARAPHDVILLAESARVALALGQPEAAQAMAQRAVEIHPDFSRGWLALALARLSAGPPDEAEPALLRAMQGSWHGDTAARREATQLLRRIQAGRDAR